MNMLKKLYKGIIAISALTVIAACSTEQLSDGELVPGDTPIQLSGALTGVSSGNLTRAVDDGSLITTGNPLFDSYYGKTDVNFYLSARTTDTPKKEYFSNIAMKVEKNSTANDGTDKLTAGIFYPLGKKEIYLYGHTGTVTNNKLTLTSGTAIANDILLGKGTSTVAKSPDHVANYTNEVSGTSEDPVTYMTFRHLMTQVTVKIVVDGTVEVTKPQNISFKFKDATTVAGTGTYDITSNAVVASDLAGTNYPITGNISGTTHYLVPTGANLTSLTTGGTNEVFSYLKIDDYIATLDDRKALKIPQADKNGTKSDFILSPGLAYTLTFHINRLKIVGITLDLNDWATKSATPTWGYDPYTLGLNVTDYAGANNNLNGNTVNKLVLKYTKDNNIYQYIGEVKDTGFSFVTLPTDLATATGLTVDIYTSDGLLANDVKATYSTGQLAIQLDQNGLKKNDTGNFFEVTTPLQFALMMKNPEAKEYRLTDDIDMNHIPIAYTPASTGFPSGATLDGKGYSILHLVMGGNGMVPVNNGTLRQIRIASGTITSTSGYVGGLCGTNNGTIEGCINEANIVATSGQTAGGICGMNSSTILACLNTGNILTGQTVGGICGENQNATAGAITACLNVGMLNKSATNLGGICGTYTGSADVGIINTCYWLTGTARKVQSTANEVAVGTATVGTMTSLTNEAADLAGSVIRNTTTIDKLTAAAGSSWKFMMADTKSSWPIPVKP